MASSARRGNDSVPTSLSSLQRLNGTLRIARDGFKSSPDRTASASAPRMHPAKPLHSDFPNLPVCQKEPNLLE